MHIITGLVIAGLASKMKKDAALKGLPRFRTGPVRVAHVLPGRIRFTVPALKGANNTHSGWVDELRSLKGVEQVEVSTVTGSVLVVFRPAEVDPPLVFGGLVRLLGLENEMERRRTPVALREVQELGKSLNFAVYDRTGGLVDLWSLAVFGLAAVGAKKMLEGGWLTLPPAFTLLWWALNAMTRGDGGRT